MGNRVNKSKIKEQKQMDKTSNMPFKGISNYMPVIENSGFYMSALLDITRRLVQTLMERSWPDDEDYSIRQIIDNLQVTTELAVERYESDLEDIQTWMESNVENYTTDAKSQQVA